jgi:hypothetical protein
MLMNRVRPIRHQRRRRNSQVPYFTIIIRAKKPAITKNSGIRKLWSQSPRTFGTDVGFIISIMFPPPVNIRKRSV